MSAQLSGGFVGNATPPLGAIASVVYCLKLTMPMEEPGIGVKRLVGVGVAQLSLEPTGGTLTDKVSHLAQQPGNVLRFDQHSRDA